MGRYRPGKAEVEDEDDDIESEEDDEAEQEAAPKPAPPKASTFPSQKKLAIDLSKADLQRTTAVEAPAQEPQDEDLEGFETASESDEDEKKGSSDEESEDESSEEEDSSSDDEPKKPMLAPKFLSKAQRNKQAQPQRTAAEIAAEEERKRKEKADEMLQAQIERDAAARAAGKKAWDDEDVAPEDEVDDTDDVDPEAERAAWKLRELKRVRRDRLAIEEKEKEREEIERRRNMSAEEREAEDRAFIEAQKEEREGKGKMGFMQKYHHKGAFFQDGEGQDEEVKAALNRDLAGARYEDEGNREVLPEYMRIRDMTQLGRKGRSKYKDLKSEDTGRWGGFAGKKRDYDGLDDRFRPDDSRDGGRERTGANDIPVGERRRGGEEKRPRYD